METTIIVSSQSTIAKSTIASEPVSKLVEFLSEWDFRAGGWDQKEVQAGDFKVVEPTEFYGRIDSLHCWEDAIKLAKELGITLAVHTDGSYDFRNTSEWDSKSFITWYDSQTRKTHQFDAFANSFAPVFTFEAVRKLSSSRKRRAFLAKFRALKELGVL